MKKIVLAAAFTVAASTAFAGNPAPAPMEPMVIIEEAGSSSGGNIWVPLLILAVIAAAVA
ncbi:MAG: hypothetical protein Q9M48_06810 [Rhodobacterales bacterium]|nr:hypothetical protein [Rhodobacterales bacterium]